MSIATVAPPPHLSADEQAAYARDGIVIPRARLSTAAVGRLREALDRLIAENPDRRPEQLVNAHLRKGPEGVRGNDVFLETARDPAIVELVAGLVGPDVILWGCQVFCKPGGDGMEVPWHQDGHYWPIRPLATTTAWIAIDDSTTENGCMRVIPRTHHDGYSEYEPVNDASKEVFATEIKKELIDESRAVDCILKPNHCSIHHAKLIHGSNANTSSMRRCGYTMRYVPASSRFRSGDFAAGAFQIYLARGQDRGGNSYGDPTKPNERWLHADREARRKAKLLAG
jgi:chlorinating enzyme